MSSRYSYNRTAAKTWEAAADDFVKDFDKLVRGQAEKVQKELAGDVAKLVKEFKDNLGKDWNFTGGRTPQSVAADLVEDVFAKADRELYDKWALNNFFRQGYFGLERSREVDLAQAEHIATVAIGDWADHAKNWNIREVKYQRRGDTLYGTVRFQESFENERSFQWVDDLDNWLKGKLGEWAKKNDLPAPRVRNVGLGDHLDAYEFEAEF